MLLSVKTTNDRSHEVVLFRQVIAGLITLNTDTVRSLFTLDRQVPLVDINDVTFDKKSAHGTPDHNTAIRCFILL